MKINQKMKIIQNTGKEWSDIANIVMQMFSEWLIVSDMQKDEFLERVNKDSFTIQYHREVENARITLIDRMGDIGCSFVWNMENGISYEDYMTDMGLLLFHISSLCTNEKSAKKIKKFISENIISK